MSKGSTPRPISVSMQDYADRWDAIFARNVDTSEKCAKETQETYTDAAEIRAIFEREDSL